MANHSAPPDFIQWSEKEVGLGFSRLDHEHQALYQLLNQLHGCIVRRDREGVSRSFQSLLQSARTHFGSEEDLLEVHNYPFLLQHREEHSKLIQEANALYAKFLSGSVSALILPNFLKDWLKQHIVTEDRKYASFLRSKGIVDGHQLILPPSQNRR